MALAVSMLRKPATKRDIATCVAKLIAAFPNAGKLDPAFARILCEDLAAYQPTFGALDAATRNLRRTATFIPTISEVLQELASASERIPGPEILAELPSRIEEARDNLERQLKLRRRREHEVAQCLKFWEDGGWSAEDFAPDVVREAQRRIHKSLEAKQE
jgi:hypothetical protein